MIKETGFSEGSLITVSADRVLMAMDATLRDYFAAKALIGICADPHHDTADMGGYDKIAEHAYSLADAMLEARK